MNKNAIKKFATEARRELISRVGQRALKYGISDKEIGNPNDDSVNGHLLSSVEKKQRTALIAQIKEKGYEQVMEEVAYTWFNRFSALRFMEVNGYLPTRVRVFTDESNAFKPQILAEAIHLELDGLDMEKVYAYKEANDTDELYKYLLITQCNALNSVLPGMFQKISDYTELLFPDNLLRDGSVIQQMIELIPEEDWQDQVQIIGWLYQYYNSEKKDDVFAALKKNVKITKENIPAATQLFTPDWIVRYMVENSLGRLWVEGHPNDELKSQWKYYLDEAKQEETVKNQLEKIRSEHKNTKLEDIKFIDPCMGSGHILCYAFDVFMQIYTSQGYRERDAAQSIIMNNIYGLDIDERAAQLAYFAVMMKAVKYDKRFLKRKDDNENPKILQPHVYAIMESEHTDKYGKKQKNYDEYALDYFCNGDAKLKAAMDTIINELYDAKEYGSIITVSQQDWSALYARLDEIKEETNLYKESVLNEIKPLIQVAEALAQKYDAVVTNPPYMGSSGMSPVLADFVKKNYPDSKSDLFACFIERGLKMSKNNGFNCMVTMQSWMFLSSFENMRKRILATSTITNLMHMENMVMGIAFGTAVSVIRNAKINGYKGTYNYVTMKDIEDEKPVIFPNKKNRFAQVSSENFSKIPGSPVAYWVSGNFANLFSGNTIRDVAFAGIGMRTGDNDRFLRLWHEIDQNKMYCSCSNANDAVKLHAKWIPYNKGGEFRRWYGNNNYVVNWENDGKEIKDNTRRVYPQLGDNLGWKISNEQYYFHEGITWTVISSSKTGFRRYYQGAIISNSGQSVISNDSELLDYLTGLLNTNIVVNVLTIISPTVGFESGYINKIPVIYKVNKSETIQRLSKSNINLSHTDWDSYETSWDFKRHPMLNRGKLADAYTAWKADCEARFLQLKANEEELNRIFIDIYGLQDELTPDVADKDVTVHRIFDIKDDVPESMQGSNYVRTMRDEVVSLISYAVGCMFGRYSLDVKGLAYAGGEWDENKYATFKADKDNIIPICDDEYFDDDIVGRFAEFVKVVYGADTLEENLRFVADALGGKGQPREVIRNYFINDFYKDHLKTYQKRPIYWLFDSGKKNGFKCLIYMHRYQPDTIARIRTDYVHEQQSRYRTAIADLENRIASASTSERVKLNKQLKRMNDQATEIHEYEEKIHHLADQMISIDLDDGVKVNYAKFQDVLAKIK